MKIYFGDRVQIIGLPFFEGATGTAVGISRVGHYHAPEWGGVVRRHFRVILDECWSASFSEPFWFPEEYVEHE